jgi:hypothetical protein
MNAIVNILRSERKIVLICGTSALAASLYERGRTAHSLFEIPVTEVRPPFPTSYVTTNQKKKPPRTIPMFTPKLQPYAKTLTVIVSVMYDIIFST